MRSTDREFAYTLSLIFVVVSQNRDVMRLVPSRDVMGQCLGSLSNQILHRKTIMVRVSDVCPPHNDKWYCRPSPACAKPSSEGWLCSCLPALRPLCLHIHVSPRMLPPPRFVVSLHVLSTETSHSTKYQMHRGLYGRANIIRVWLDFWWCFAT